jgi:flagellar L-ring protein precursor FlgH
LRVRVWLFWMKACFEVMAMTKAGWVEFCMVVLLFMCIPAGSWAQGSLYTDLKATDVGDVVTIIILEKTMASHSSGLDTEKESRFFTEGSGTGPMDFVNPFSLSANIGREHEGRGSTDRRGSIVGRMAATVVGVAPNGNLEIEGKREIVINDEKEILTITGTVRPQDISTDNVVYSTDIANTQIAYKGKGMVNSGNKPGIISRIVSFFF